MPDFWDVRSGGARSAQRAHQGLYYLLLVRTAARAGKVHRAHTEHYICLCGGDIVCSNLKIRILDQENGWNSVYCCFTLLYFHKAGPDLCPAAVKTQLAVYYPHYRTSFITYRDCGWKDE